jgi:transcriptional regulator with XRE-family HTH domain
MNTRQNAVKNSDQIRRDLEARVAALQAAPIEPEMENAVALREGVANHVYKVMQAQGVSQAELARRLGKSRAHVCKILGGGANLTLDSLAALSAALNCRLEVCFKDQAGSTPSLRPPARGKQLSKNVRLSAPANGSGVRRNQSTGVALKGSSVKQGAPPS